LNFSASRVLFKKGHPLSSSSRLTKFLDMAAIPNTEERWLELWLKMSERQRYVVRSMLEDIDLTLDDAKQILAQAGIESSSAPSTSSEGLDTLRRVIKREP
jgi:hypothetical protein